MKNQGRRIWPQISQMHADKKNQDLWICADQLNQRIIFLFLIFAFDALRMNVEET